jgi:dipeptidyl aminopeptidase/acylaminoacyl peptidase
VDIDPEWSPDGNKLVISTQRFGPDRKLALVDLNTKVVTQLTFGAGSDSSPDFSPDGSRIVYESTANGNGFLNLFTVPVGGGAPTPQHASVAENRREPHYSPDGSQVSFFISDDLYRTPSQPSQPPTLLAENAALPAFGTAWSPDGKFIAATPDEGGISRIHRYNVPSGIDAGPLLMPGSGTSLFEPSWGPLVVDRTFVTTTGGLFGTRASGFIYTQGGSQGNSNRCVLAFDATTPTSVVLTQQTGLNSEGPNLVFSIDADTLTYLTYANGDAWMPVRLIGNAQLPSANGALASFSSSTGFLTGLIPFNGSRAAGTAPKVSEENGSTIFRGSFPAVLDAAGKNLAPGGATEVRVGATGEVRVIQE